MKKKYIKRPPRVFKNDKGRFIIRRGKKVYINSPQQSNKQIVNIVLNNVRNRRRVKRPPKKDIINSKIDQYTKIATDAVSDRKISASESSSVLNHQLELQKIKRMLEVEKERNNNLIKQATDEGKQKLIKENAQRQQQIQQIEDVIDLPNAPKKTLEAAAKKLYTIQNDIYKLKQKKQTPAVALKLKKKEDEYRTLDDEVIDKYNSDDVLYIYSLLHDKQERPNYRGRIRESQRDEDDDEEDGDDDSATSTTTTTTSTIGDKIKNVFSPKKKAKPDEEMTDAEKERIAKDAKDLEDLIKNSKKDKGKEKDKDKKGTGPPDNSLYDSEINKIMDFFDAKDYGFKGVYSSDELNEIKISPSEKRISFIMNTSPKSVATGHWVSIYIDKEEGTLEYFDSLAQEPSDDFKIRIKKLIDKMNLHEYLVFKINKIKHQANSSSCGYHAMMFLLGRYEGRSFKDVSGYSIVREAEKNVQQFKEKLKQKFGYI